MFSKMTPDSNRSYCTRLLLNQSQVKSLSLSLFVLIVCHFNTKTSLRSLSNDTQLTKSSNSGNLPNNF